MRIDSYRLSLVALCVSAGLALGILVSVLSVRTHDLEQLHEQDKALIAEGQEAHDALCVLREGYFRRQQLFYDFLNSGLYVTEGERTLVRGLIASFDTTLFALRNMECPTEG